MDADYVTALEYGKRHGLSKQWIIKLARAGRIDGAQLAGGVWAIPADAAVPERMVPGPKMRLDSARHVRAVARVERKVERTAEVMRKSIMTKSEIQAEATEKVLSTMTPQQRHVYKNRRNGFRLIQTVWEDVEAQDWAGPAWMPDESANAFETRLAQWEAWEDSGREGPAPSWLPVAE